MISGSVLTRYELLHPDIAPIIPPNTAAPAKQSHLREIELGLRNPTVETLSYFCDALGVTLEEFFREDDSEINPYLMSALTRLNDKEQMALANFLNAMKPSKT